MFTIDFEIIGKKKHPRAFYIKKQSKDYLGRLSQYKNMEVKYIYILVVENIQYSGNVSGNVPVVPARSRSQQDQSTVISDSHPNLLKAEVGDRTAYRMFVIFQTKRNEC